MGRKSGSQGEVWLGSLIPLTVFRAVPDTPPICNSLALSKTV
jgi:hypothetical protein